MHPFWDGAQITMFLTYASLMIAASTPLVVVSRRLGHAQVSTTSNIYSYIIWSADRKTTQISDKFPGFFLSLPTKKLA